MTAMTRQFYRSSEGLAVMENGRLTEYIGLHDETQSGDIILGKADRIMSSLDCAFINIGRKRDGFLPLRENSKSFIDPPIRSGELLPVQIRREENGDKGAFLSRDLTFPGKYIILMPKNRYIGVSSRISDESERNALKETGAMIAGGRFGMVMRSAATHASQEDIRSEAEELSAVWNRVRSQMSSAGKPGHILFSQDPVSMMIRDYGADRNEIIQVQDMPSEVNRQLSVSKERKIRLPAGGNIIIDRCEAMTVIDVNSASAVLAGSKEETATATNLESCMEIASQIRLRDLSGIILIDFIDMDRAEDRDQVERKLLEALAADRRKTVVHGWTKLGIMEMTRKRN